MPMTAATSRLRLQLVAAEHSERIGRRIEARRLELGLKRREVAERIPGPTNENAIYRWENGKHRPGDEMLERIAKALEVADASYFMLPDPVPDTPDLMAALPNANSDNSQMDRIEAALIEQAQLLRKISDGLAAAPLTPEALCADLEQLLADLDRAEGRAAQETKTRQGGKGPPGREMGVDGA